MLGKTRGLLHEERNRPHLTAAFSMGGAAILLALVGIFTPTTDVLTALIGPTCSSTGTSEATAAEASASELTAYSLWLSNGNSGSEQDFLDSLVGDPGLNGFQGLNGESAYELWLKAGNSGSTNDFLKSLVGSSGVQGVAGLSAFDLWQSIGNSGTVADFIRSLQGAIGANGAAGTQGSAGATGPTGAVGAAGKSAYEIWVDNGHTGQTVAEFLASLVGTPGAAGSSGAQGPAGSPGPTGTTGATGPAGENGQCVLGLGGYAGSFQDNTTQTSIAEVNPIVLGQTLMSKGVTVQGSALKFEHAGTYNIAFSAQLVKKGGSEDVVSIWLRQNGKNVENSASKWTLADNNRYVVAAWNFFVSVADGDTVELVWNASAGRAEIVAEPASGELIPAIPSVILTVNQID